MLKAISEVNTNYLKSIVSFKMPRYYITYKYFTRGERMFTKILLATDGSKHSLRATEYAIELAMGFSGTIDVVYVIDDNRSNVDVLHHHEKVVLEEKRRDRIKTVEELIKKSNVEYVIHILHGEAGPTLIRFIDDHDSNCVVIGSRGLNNLQTFLLGSVSHKVAKRASCPVLIVK